MFDLYMPPNYQGYSTYRDYIDYNADEKSGYRHTVKFGNRRQSRIAINCKN